MKTREELERRVLALLQGRFPVPEGVEAQRFSQFDREQVTEASEISDEMSRAAEDRGGVDGIEAGIALAEQEVTRRLPAIVKYALMLFLTHDPLGSALGVPALEVRHPQAVLTMLATREARAEADPASLS